MGGLVVWMVIVIAGFMLPAKQIVPFLAMGVAIGIVLGGTQALSRSAFSQLIPKGREAEYFSLYQAGERGTSWLGTLVFGLVHQLTGSYRPAIVALGLFFLDRPRPALPRRHAPRHHRSRQRPTHDGLRDGLPRPPRRQPPPTRPRRDRRRPRSTAAERAAFKYSSAPTSYGAVRAWPSRSSVTRLDSLAALIAALPAPRR